MSGVKKILKGLSPNFIKDLILKFRISQYRKSISKKTMHEVFEHIYEKNVWGNKKNVSGGGSTIIKTKKIVAELPALFEKYNISSVLDLPCGDFIWMKEVDLSGIDYIGGDIVQKIVDINNEKYSNKFVKFTPLNVVNDPLPEADLILCRDCFVHLSLEQIGQSLENIRKSQIKYLLVTSFTQRSENKEIITGEWRPINMEIAPFNLRAIEVLNEGYSGKDASFNDKSLILIDLRGN